MGLCEEDLACLPSLKNLPFCREFCVVNQALLMRGIGRVIVDYRGSFCHILLLGYPSAWLIPLLIASNGTNSKQVCGAA